MSDSRKKRWDQNARRFEEEIKQLQSKKAQRDQADPLKQSSEQKEMRRLASLLDESRDVTPVSKTEETDNER